jgi:hypothetical protein
MELCAGATGWAWQVDDVTQNTDISLALARLGFHQLSGSTAWMPIDGALDDYEFDQTLWRQTFADLSFHYVDLEDAQRIYRPYGRRGCSGRLRPSSAIKTVAKSHFGFQLEQ